MHELERVKPLVVILAAGASRRLGECKALVDIAGRNPLERLLDAAAEFSGARPVIVTGADHEAIAARGPCLARMLFNPDWERGAAGGVARAHEAHPEFDLCLVPVDVPLVPRAVFAALFEAWERAGAPPHGWLAPQFVAETHPTSSEGNSARRYGHPVIVGRRLLDAADSAATLQHLRARADRLLSVAVPHSEILDDLDTPEDLARLRERAMHSRMDEP